MDIPGKAVTNAAAAVQVLPPISPAISLPQSETLSGLLPSFFIVGPPRTGTTWIHEVLRDRAILPGPVKETRFFDVHFHRGLAWYQAHFKQDGLLRPGEIAPTYFASHEARVRIAQLVPSATIVCILRNPVERLFSLYRLKCAYGMLQCSFEEALRQDPELLESSDYVLHLKAWQRSFGAANILVSFYDDLRRSPQRFMDAICASIGIPAFTLTVPQVRRIHDSESLTHPRLYQCTKMARLTADFLKARRLGRVVASFNRSRLRTLVIGGGRPFSTLSRATAARLYAQFRPQVEELETMLNRDLAEWKLPAK